TLETQLGWAARILGFYAKTPVFAGANEREIGLLLKASGLAWAREGLALQAPAPKITQADVRRFVSDLAPNREKAESFERLEDASLNDLGGRAMSQDTRDVYHQMRDFLSAAARQLVEREQTEHDNEPAFHQVEQ